MSEDNVLIKHLHFYKTEEQLPNVSDYKEDFPFGDIEFIVHVKGHPYCTVACFYNNTFVPTDVFMPSDESLQFANEIDYWAPMIKWEER